MTLPWWDWSTAASIPPAYAIAQADGTENVLAKAPIKVFNTAAKSGWPTETSRDPGEIPQTPAPPYKQEWANAMKATNYMEFSQRIWTVHDTLHVWVGGTMGQVDWAAYDPIFFAHHANVDRAWRFWQAAHPEPVSPFDQRPPHPLIPFNATLEITDALSALPEGTSQITVTVLAFNKNGDEANGSGSKT